MSDIGTGAGGGPASAAGGGNAVFARMVGTLRSGEIALALGVVAILLVLLLPMPKWLLDAGLALSITLSVLILMTSLFIHRPLDFSSFPTILLISTMLRLALNLATTRLILSEGHNGTDEDTLTYAMFPQVAPKFFKERPNGPLNLGKDPAGEATVDPNHPGLLTKDIEYTVTVNGKTSRVKVGPAGA